MVAQSNFTVNPNFVVNEQGKKVFVQLSFKEWEKLMHELRRLQVLIDFKEELKTAFREVREIKEGKRKAISLNEFLDEVESSSH
jgi:hypothetical protein